MSNRKLSGSLVDLIKGLSRAEKKHFRTYARRNSKERELKSLQLFDIIDKTPDGDKELIFKKRLGFNSGQLNELKGRLYEQLLVSLRLLHRQQPELSIREQIDWATILYSRGLYNQSFVILEKAKEMAQKQKKDVLLFEIAEFEWQLQTKHIEKGFVNRTNELSSEIDTLHYSIVNQGKLSNLAATFYGAYIGAGHVKNLQELNDMKTHFEYNTANLNENQLSFFGKTAMYRAYWSYYFVCMDFEKAALYSSKWVSLFEQEPAAMKTEIESYLKGLFSYLNTLFLYQDTVRFDKYFKQLEKFSEENTHLFDNNLKSQTLQYVEISRLNLFFLEGRYDEGMKYVDEFVKCFSEVQLSNFQHKILTMEFNYKIAVLYFVNGNFKQAVKYLNMNVNDQGNPCRIDIQSFSRILLLLVHFELENTDLLSYQLKQVTRFLEKNNEFGQLASLIINFINTHLYSNKKQLKTAFSEFHYRILDVIKDPYEKRLIQYFDLEAWVVNKIQETSMQENAQRKFLLKQGVDMSIGTKLRNPFLIAFIN